MQQQAVQDVDAGFCERVKVTRVQHASPDRGWALLQAEDPHGQTVTLAGALGHLHEGDEALVTGRWEHHPRYGRQVAVQQALPVDPDDLTDRVRVLTKLPSIGEARARRLLATFGPDSFAQLDNDPIATLLAVGLNDEQAQATAREWSDRRAHTDMYLLLAPHGGAALVDGLVREHGARAKDLVQSNPYLLTYRSGGSFRIAERLARTLGGFEHSDHRARAALVHTVGDLERQGNTWCERTVALGVASDLIAERVEDSHLWAAEQAGHLHLGDDGDQVSLARTYRDERTIATRLSALLHGGEQPALAGEDLTASSDQAVRLTDDQQQAITTALTSGVSVVTGGPGTGKTSMQRALCRVAASRALRVALAAPTGRGARQLQREAAHPATTVHRLLEWGHAHDSNGVAIDGPLRTADHPLEVDLLVVDEASMLDVHTAAALLRAVPNTARLVLVGDADQLPSVGPGRVLADIIDSNQVPTTRLRHVFRQAEQSMIVQAAHSVNRGEYPALSADQAASHDFFMLSEPDPQVLVDRVSALVCDRLPTHYDVDPMSEILLLCPSHHGPAGGDVLNERIGRELNPDGRDLSRAAKVRVGDRAMWTRNDVELDLMNGMLVTVLHDLPDARLVVVQDEDGRLVHVPYEKVVALSPAYAMSVHKAQGGQAPVVVIVLHRDGTHPALLSRPLLYTALTRAQRAVVVIGEPQALAQAISQVGGVRRRTCLPELLLTA